MTSKVEFLVEISCNSCVQAIEQKLKDVDGINKFSIIKETGSVIVESQLPTDKVLNLLESTGKKVRIKGLSGDLAAVSMIQNANMSIQGVVRFMQDEYTGKCVIDGTLDGLESDGKHAIHIHECGDLSNGCENVGPMFMPPIGDLGHIEVSEMGRASFRFTKDKLRLCDMIGRSFVVKKCAANEKSDECSIKIACGIIARSAGLFQNPKTICACDGVSIWDERHGSHL